MISSGPLAGGHFQSLGGKNQRKDEFFGEFRLFLLMLLILFLVFLIRLDHEEEQDHEQEGGSRLCFVARPL
jgi:hypothetical protein